MIRFSEKFIYVAWDDGGGHAGYAGGFAFVVVEVDMPHLCCATDMDGACDGGD